MEHSKWQSLLQLGNECFHNQQWRQAEDFYIKAFDLLSLRYQNNPLSSDLLMAWTCSCHNLAALYEVLGDLNASLRFLMIPHEHLNEISESETVPDDIKIFAFKGMNLTTSPILFFIKKHPICDGCLAQFKTLKKLIEHQSCTIH